MPQLIPPDSPLRRVPTSVDKRTILYLDGIRYSIEIAELAVERLAATLKQLGDQHAEGQHDGRLIVAAMSDAWMFVDAVHRLRELVQQTPGLKQNDSSVQLFLRSTKEIEHLRHLVQHFRSGIDDFISLNLPLWGALTWGVSNQVDKTLTNYIIFPGTMFNGVEAIGLAIDTYQSRFCQVCVLQAGKLSIDLGAIGDKVARFANWYKDWFNSKFASEPRHGADGMMWFEVEFEYD